MKQSLTEQIQQQQNKAIYRQAFGFAFDYLDKLESRPVFPPPEALDALRIFDQPLPEESTAAESILRMLHEVGSPATTAIGGGRYFGFVNGGALPIGLAARLLADVWDQNAALHIMSPIAAKLEQVCEDWLVELFELPAGTAAGLVSGTSMATLCGALAARDALLRRRGWDVGQRGLFGAPPIRVVLSEGAHASVGKALAIAGIGTAQIERVPADDQGRFDSNFLPPLDDNTLLILQAGNVNSGAFDDFESLCAAAREAGAWVHIDGAFGLWARACEETSHLTASMELADSWSADAHKTLNSPYDCGIIFCKDRQALTVALGTSGSYLQFSDGRDGMLYTPEMSRRARAIELWALIKGLGRSGIDDLVAQLCRRARQFAEGLASRDFRILNEVAFNQVLVACDSAELTTRTLELIQTSGECWCGGSQWKGEPVMRISVCSWATTEDDIARSVRAFVAARECASSII